METGIIRILKARFSAAKQERDSLLSKLADKDKELAQLAELLKVARTMESNS